MKNFKKLSLKALNNDELSKIKGGAMNMTCEEAYERCSRNPDICYPTGGWQPPQGWYDCLAELNPNCSPLSGWGICESL